MPILADPTEERHLHPSLRERTKFVAGIESLTGADLILSPLPLPATDETLLRRHAQAGVCVQRKDVGDFVASITADDNRLWTQLARLRSVADSAWLLLIGDIKRNRDGKAVIDGRESGWEYWKVSRARVWWQLRGGYIDWVSTDSGFVEWCLGMEKSVIQWHEEGGMGTKIIVRPISQTLYEVDSIVRTLMTFPGMGEERA